MSSGYLSDPYRFLGHGGEAGQTIRNHNWAATPLGPVETWSSSGT
jgi:hypothetical protein